MILNYPNYSISRVVVLYGGWSHETNYAAYPSVIRSLSNLGIEAIPIDVRDSDFVCKIRECLPDAIFLTNQGAYGEDGKLQGMFDILDIPYVGSGVCASAIGMNKLASKLVFQGMGLKVAKYIFCPLGSHPSYSDLVRLLGSPIVIKPIMAGASFGTSLIKTPKDFEERFPATASEFGDLLFEEFIDGDRVEYASGIIEDERETIKLPVCQVRLKTEFFSHQAKFSTELYEQITPAPIDESTTSKMQDIAYKVHCSLGCSGMSRTDMILSKDGEIYILEFNTSPGLLPTSIYPQECQAAGIEYDQMILMLIRNTFRRRPMEIPKIYANLPELPDNLTDS